MHIENTEETKDLKRKKETENKERRKQKAEDSGKRKLNRRNMKRKDNKQTQKKNVLHEIVCNFEQLTFPIRRHVQTRALDSVLHASKYKNDRYTTLALAGHVYYKTQSTRVTIDISRTCSPFITDSVTRRCTNTPTQTLHNSPAC
jgi:predicted ATP-dependent protease